MILDVDRIEGNYAVCYDEEGNKIDLRLDRLPVKPVEGNKLIIKDKKFILKEVDSTKINNLFEKLKK